MIIALAHKKLRLGLSLLGAAAGMALLSVSSAFADGQDYGGSRTVIFKSHATDLTTGETLYTERHTYVERDGSPQMAEVMYHDPAGNIWATKKLTFSNGTAAPFFHRENMKTGYQEGFVAADDAGSIGTLFHRAKGEKQGCGETFSARSGHIVDAGFNQHLQKSLPELAQGNKLRFDLLVPKACRAVEFEAAAKQSDDPAVLLVSMRPTNLLARLVVPDTQVMYNRQTGALVGYRGLSDLTDDQGRTMKVAIEFERPEILTADVAAQSNVMGRLDSGEQGNEQD